MKKDRQHVESVKNCKTSWHFLTATFLTLKHTNLSWPQPPYKIIYNKVESKSVAEQQNDLEPCGGIKRKNSFSLHLLPTAGEPQNIPSACTTSSGQPGVWTSAKHYLKVCHDSGSTHNKWCNSSYTETTSMPGGGFWSFWIALHEVWHKQCPRTSVETWHTYSTSIENKQVCFMCKHTCMTLMPTTNPDPRPNLILLTANWWLPMTEKILYKGRKAN